jgi:Family of unknown function (DUF6263)
MYICGLLFNRKFNKMKIKKLGFVLALIAVVLFACNNTESTEASKVLLRLNPEKGQAYNYALNTEMNIEMMGMNSTAKMLIDYTMIANEVNDEGSKFGVKYNRVYFDQEAPMGGSGSYDSDEPDSAKGMFGISIRDFMGKLMDATVVMTFNKLGELGEISGLEDLFQEGQSMGTGKDFAKQFQAVMPLFPEEEIGVGDEWSNDISTSVAQMPMKMVSKYKVKSISSDEVVLDVSGDIATDESEGSEMMSMDISGNFSGEMTLNRKTGLVNVGNLDQDITAKMSQGGMEMELSVINKISIETK